MTDAAAVATADSPPRKRVKFRVLLALYVIVPASFLLVVWDQALNGGGLRESLPRHPEGLAFYAVVFNLPHILSGHLLLLDREYGYSYRKQLIGGGLAFGALMMFGPPGLIAVVGLVLLTFHVLGQQLGLTAPQIRVSDWSFGWWKYLCILIGGLGYYATVAQAEGGEVPDWAQQFAWVSVALMPPALLLALRLSKRSATRGGRLYLWANQVMVMGMYGLGAAGYPMLSVLMPRFVHDLTAFYVYGVHDENRNAESQPNPVYRALRFTGLSPRIISPAFGIGLALLVKELPHEYRLPLVAWLSGMHYYLESFVWRSGSLHRKSVGFV